MDANTFGIQKHVSYFGFICCVPIAELELKMIKQSFLSISVDVVILYWC